MAIRQLSIFLENRKGRLASIVNILAEARINVRGMSIADTNEFGILRLIVDETDRAIEVLKAKEVMIHVNDVTAVEVSRHPGGLAKVLDLLRDTSINVEYMYTLAEPKNENPILLLRFSEPGIARAILRDGGVKLLDENELQMK